MENAAKRIVKQNVATPITALLFKGPGNDRAAFDLRIPIARIKLNEVTAKRDV